MLSSMNTTQSFFRDLPVEDVFNFITKHGCQFSGDRGYALRRLYENGLLNNSEQKESVFALIDSRPHGNARETALELIEQHASSAVGRAGLFAVHSHEQEQPAAILGDPLTR